MNKKLKLLIITILILGIFFRLSNLDGKIYWHDEAYTSMRVASYTKNEILEDIFKGQIIERDDLQKYQRLNPETGLKDIIHCLAIDNPQHPPFYYLLLRLWMNLFGDSITAIRSFSAVISLLVFPCIYWLCRELFGNSTALIGWMAIALVAVSPFHILYAQEAREYSLWTVMILLSSIALLKALRFNKAKLWTVYGLTLTLSFYTHPLSLPIAIGNSIYVLAIKDFRKKILAYFGTSIIALLCFAFWLAIIITSWNRVGSTWTAIPIRPISWLQAWVANINNIFLFTTNNNPEEQIFTYVIFTIFGLISLYSLYFSVKNAEKKEWLFILTLTFSLALSLVIPDLIKGGQRSISTRYLIPFILGIQLSLAYLFAHKIYQQKLWQIIIAGVLTVGVISCCINYQATTAWSKVVSYNNGQVADIINQKEKPLLITRRFAINFGNIFALSHLLQDQVKFQLIDAKLQPHRS